MSDAAAEKDPRTPEQVAAEEAQGEVEWEQRPVAPNLTRIVVSNATVRGVDEERYADDHLYVQARGQVKTAAQVELTFDQTVTIPVTMNGQQVMAAVKLGEFQTKGLAPELAIQLGELMIEEAKRVMQTRKEQPLKPGGGLVIAGSDADVQAAAAALDPDKLAKR